MPDPSPRRRFWDVLVPTLFRTPANESTPLHERFKRSFFARSESHLQASKGELTGVRLQRKTAAGKEDEEHKKDVDLFDVSPVSDFMYWHLNTMVRQCSANAMTRAVEQNSHEGRQLEEPLSDADTLLPDGPAKFDINKNGALWKLLKHARGKDTTSDNKNRAKMSYDPSPEVVEICAARGFRVSFILFILLFLLEVEQQRFVTRKREHKTKKSSAFMTGATTAYASSSSQAVPTLHDGHVRVNTSSCAFPAPQGMIEHGGQYSHVAGRLANYCTNDDDSHSDASIRGSWHKFLDKLCFPCGHYYEEDA